MAFSPQELDDHAMGKGYVVRVTSLFSGVVVRTYPTLVQPPLHREAVGGSDMLAFLFSWSSNPQMLLGHIMHEPGGQPRVRRH